MTQILPVIHMRNYKEALYNANLAFELGAHGVFFINHGDCATIDMMEVTMDASLKGKNVGINLLGTDPIEALFFAASVENIKMLWTDNAFVNKEEFQQKFHRIKSKLCPSLQYFGGVAFKYQLQPISLSLEAELARGKMEVLCTSGDGTGIAPSINKLKVLKERFNGPIAVASGVTPENIHTMQDYIDYALVATGIGKDFYNIDPEKLSTMIDKVKLM